MPVIREGKIGDFIRGVDTWLHGAQMLGNSVLVLLLVGGAIVLSVSSVWTYARTSACTLELAETAAQAHWRTLIHSPRGFIVPPPCGSNIQEIKPTRHTASGTLRVPHVVAARDEVISRFLSAAGLTLLVLVPAWIYAVRRSVERGKRLAEDSLLRGTYLVDAEVVARHLSESDKASDLTLGIPVVEEVSDERDSA